jgi:hypothetical protein
MKTQPILTRTLCIALAGFILGAGHTAFARGTKQIRGQFAGHSEVTQIGNGVYRQVNVATGNLTHIGRVTAEWTVREVRVGPGSTLIVAQPDWTGVLRTPNGDQLLGVYSFRSSTLSISPAGEVQFVTDLEITGGTGRFTGASGQAVGTGRGNIWTGQFTIDLSGTITLR